MPCLQAVAGCNSPSQQHRIASIQKWAGDLATYRFQQRVSKLQERAEFTGTNALEAEHDGALLFTGSPSTLRKCFECFKNRRVLPLGS
jgi:hypothetical protein